MTFEGEVPQTLVRVIEGFVDWFGLWAVQFVPS
jgi:hypothetical protein